MLNRESKTFDLKHCDVIKVFMMLSVMFYHCICLWSKGGWFNQPPAQSSQVLAFLCSWFNSFHIYVFTFVSGYLFYYLKYEKERYKSFFKDTLHRATRLLIPYVFASLLWVIPFYVYYYSPKPLTVVKNFALAESPNQLWFLMMIFAVFVIFYPLSNSFNKIGFFGGGVLSIIIYIVATLGALLLPNIFQIWTAGKYIFFFYLGFAFRKYKNNIFYKIPWFCYFSVQILLLAIKFFYISNQNGRMFALIEIVISPIINTIGVLTVITLLCKFNFSRIKNLKLFSLLSKHNFAMYLFHQQLIYVTISLFNNKLATPLLVLVNFTFSFTVSLFMSVLISKIPVVKKMFGYK